MKPTPKIVPLSKEELEAQTAKYGNEGAILIQLSTGNWAVFSKHYELRRIVPEEDLLKVLKTVTGRRRRIEEKKESLLTPKSTDRIKIVRLSS